VIKNDIDVLEEIQKEENNDSSICNLVTEKTLEIAERPLENVFKNCDSALVQCNSIPLYQI
jgi:hypothetical protein